MACRRSALRSLAGTNPSQRSFSSTSSCQKLGAATYAQEWNTGTYHFNKSTSKLVPFAHQQTDKLLQQYITQQRKQVGYVNKAAIASHRRKYDKMYVSGSKVKDFGNRVEVEAYVFDGAKAAARDRAAKDGGKKGGAQGQVPKGSDGQGSGEGGAGRRQGGSAR